MIAALKDVDVSPLMGKIACPTLVLAGRDYPSPEATREIAAGITNASLIPLEEGTHPVAGNTETADAAIEQFLHEDDQPAGERTDTLPEGTAIILFADIAGSTALTEQLGDSAFRAKARELDTSLRSVIRDSGGTPVEGKVLGDGVMAVFTSARQAIDGAIRCNAAAQDTGLSLHLGIHAGDVIREGSNVYGGAVNIAARIAGASAPGELLVSDTVRSLARTSADVAFDDRGEHELKGIGEPQRLYAVREGGT
jgi:class 3 adenylate cyclase